MARIPTRKQIKVTMCHGRRRLIGQDNQVGICSIISRNNRDTKDKFPAEKSRNLDVASLEEQLKSKVSMVLEGNMVNNQKNELSGITENTAVLCKTVVNSD